MLRNHKYKLSLSEQLPTKCGTITHKYKSFSLPVNLNKYLSNACVHAPIFGI